jgi:hypothetical protein
MARLKKTLVVEREAEATAAFKTGATAKDVNEALFSKYRMRMSLKRLGELKKAAFVVAPVTVVVPPEVTE